jgi:hypothetical protein
LKVSPGRQARMKIFYTERDIEDMYRSGLTRLEVHDDVVLTDLAREKAVSLGIALVAPGQASSSVPTPTVSSLATPPANPPDLVGRIRANVIARLGTNDYNELIDQIIPQVLARLNAPPNKQNPASTPSQDKY